MTSFAKDAGQDEQTDSTNQEKHHRHCEEQNNASSRPSQVAEGQQEICQHKLGIVAKKWEPGNLVPSRFSGQIRKVEARLGKLEVRPKTLPEAQRTQGIASKLE